MTVLQRAGDVVREAETRLRTMVNLSVNAIFYLILAIVIVLILLPILYSRALRRRGKSASLRQFVWRDPELRQGLLEEHNCN